MTMLENVTSDKTSNDEISSIILGKDNSTDPLFCDRQEQFTDRSTAAKRKERTENEKTSVVGSETDTNTEYVEPPKRKRKKKLIETGKCSHCHKMLSVEKLTYVQAMVEREGMSICCAVPFCQRHFRRTRPLTDNYIPPLDVLYKLTSREIWIVGIDSEGNAMLAPKRPPKKRVRKVNPRKNNG
jgi:hypothetical protein